MNDWPVNINIVMKSLADKHILKQIQFHDTLNPLLWTGDKLRPEVRLKLFQAAVAFYRFLDLPRLIVKDIIITGSNAAYNYTELSDIDVHLLVDFTHSSCPQMASNFFTTKKALWSKTYDVTVRTHAIELYVEDIDVPVVANGIYSILHAKWLRTPSREPPKADDEALTQKVKAFAAEMDALLSGQPTIRDIDEMLNLIYELRQNGLMNGGEFSVENSAFKALRSLGYLDKLHDKRIKIKDAALSL